MFSSPPTVITTNSCKWNLLDLFHSVYLRFIYMCVYISSLFSYCWAVFNYSQISVLEYLPSLTIRLSTKLFMERNVSLDRQNFGSWPDNPFVLIRVWPVTSLSGDRQRRECASVRQFAAKPQEAVLWIFLWAFFFAFVTNYY